MATSDFSSRTKSYWKFHAFVTCDRMATRSINPNRVVQVLTDAPCYTLLSSGLFLCATCAEFWRDCGKNDNYGTWQMACFFRDLREPTELASAKHRQ